MSGSHRLWQGVELGLAELAALLIVVGVRIVISAGLGEATNPSELSAIRFSLAQALWDGHGDRARARKLAGEALLGEPAPSTRTEIETWIAQHRR